MTEIQERLFTLLCEVDEICKKHSIPYYLAAGCALGAVRNGGFLPWDDDVDLYITRDNWEKLCKVMPEEIKENRAFITSDNTDYYWNPISRYVDKESTVMLKSQLLGGACCGVFVEFFVFDPMPADEELKREHRKNLKVWIELLNPYFVVNRKPLTINSDFDINLYNRCVERIKTEGRQKILSELYDGFTSTPEEGCDSYCMRWGQRPYIFPAYHFEGSETVVFEGWEFPALVDPNGYLRKGYGDDWMYVPTPSGVVTHNMDISINTPFEDIVDIYMPRIDRENCLQAYKQIKELRMRNLIRKQNIQCEYADIKAELMAEEMKLEYADMKNVNRALKSGDLDALEESLDAYNRLQNDPFIIEGNSYIKSSDHLLHAMLTLYLKSGKYYAADRLLKRRKDCWIEGLSNEVKKDQKIIEYCRALSIAIYDKADVARVKKLLEEYPDREGFRDCDKAALWIMRMEAETNDDFEMLAAMAVEKAEMHKMDGELIYHAAYAQYRLGNINKAKELYKVAVDNTRNGVVRREAKELAGITPYVEEIEL